MAKQTKTRRRKGGRRFSLVGFLQGLLFWVVVLFFGGSVLLTVAYRWVPVYLTPLMVIRCVEQKIAGEEPRLHHAWVPLEEMSKYMPVAVMASEDQRFLVHDGFDYKAISEALEEKAEGRRIRGGSTISQQTAKNVFLWPGRSWVRKGFEAYFTFLIERLWGKHRIMEVYLNSIEMGDGIYGTEAVAIANFHCKASGLTRSDCALIAATLPNPLRYNSRYPSRYMLQRQAQIGRQMRHIDLFE